MGGPPEGLFRANAQVLDFSMLAGMHLITAAVGRWYMACSKSTVIVTLVLKKSTNFWACVAGMRVAYHTLQPESANFELLSPLMPTTFRPYL